MPDLSVVDPHARLAGEVAERLAVLPQVGLPSDEAARRVFQVGPNRLRQQKPANTFVLLSHQFQSIIVWLLAAAALFSFLIGDRVETAAIGVVLLLNAAIGFVTELRAARSMEALQKIADVRTRVRRGGTEEMIDARDLVPGDVVILDAGDVVTADLRLNSAAGLHVDESVLTGESAPVAKSIDPVAEDTALADRSCMIFKGTAITQGAGEALVVSTGMSTELGRISCLAETAEAVTSPLENRLERLGRTLIGLTLLLVVGTVAAGYWRGHDLFDMIQTGVALAVAAIPEGLPVVATLSLARGMLRMARRNAVIRRLSAVETLGATTLILTDKTGTLTENRMTAVSYLLNGGDMETEQEIAAELTKPFELALTVGALCNNATLGTGAEDGTGDPMELALLQAARRAGGRAKAPPRVLQHAFDPERRMMATVHQTDDGLFLAVKGAPEAVLESCTQVLGPTGPAVLDDSARQSWSQRNDAAAASGLRTLGLAMKGPAQADDAPYAELTFLGLVCLADPLRPEIPPAIAACHQAGIRVVMVTGDHAATAAQIASEAGIRRSPAAVIEGRELEDGPDFSENMRARLRSTEIIARAAPHTKLALVGFFQAEGQIVAMTGDGVNDAPALRKADIGVAMGQRGTQVAREAAHMVLKDDNLATIVEAVRQGRVIFGNIRKFVVYLMSCNLCEVLIVALAVCAGLPVPLLPLHILFLNLVTDVFPAFALGLGKGDGQEMQRAPRDPAEPIIGHAEWVRIGLLGGLITLATLFAFVLALEWLDLSAHKAVTVAFVTLALAQLWNVFNVRASGTSVLRNDVTHNAYVWSALALCLVLIGLALWWPALSGVLGLPMPGAAGLGLALGMSLVPLVLGQALISRRAPRAVSPAPA